MSTQQIPTLEFGNLDGKQNVNISDQIQTAKASTHLMKTNENPFSNTNITQQFTTAQTKLLQGSPSSKIQVTNASNVSSDF